MLMLGVDDDGGCFQVGLLWLLKSVLDVLVVDDGC